MDQQEDVKKGCDREDCGKDGQCPCKQGGMAEGGCCGGGCCG